MKNNQSLKKLIILFVVFIVMGFLLKTGGDYLFSSEPKKNVPKNSILKLELNGVILNGKKFLKALDKYGNDEKVKAIVVNINSPGGAVGPSQEIYSELKKLKEKEKKPVVCVSSGLLASGAYYVASACDKIIVAPGAMVGSIGVIMEFANLEKLYDWAKISRYTITSGKFKDSGAEYRAMRDDERQLFQDMITEVYKQFRTAVSTARGLDEETMDKYADGRVFTGDFAVKMKFADAVGTYSDAEKMAASLANLGDNYEMFEVPKRTRSIFDLGDTDDDFMNSLSEYSDVLAQLKKGKFELSIADVSREILNMKFLNQPMFLMPGFWK